MSRALLTIRSKKDREQAAALIDKVPPGTRVEFKGARRTLEQNNLLWGDLTDISRQHLHHGRRLTPDQWKTVLIADFRQEATDLVLNLDGDGFIDLKHSSSDMSKEEMSQFIEHNRAKGAEWGVKFTSCPVEPQESPPVRFMPNGVPEPARNENELRAALKASVGVSNG